MAKVQVFLPEPPQEFSSESFRQINQLNTSYQREQKNENETFNYFLS